MRIPLRITQKKSKRVWLRVEPDQHARLKALAKKHRASVNATVIYAIDLLLQAEEDAADVKD
jgi:predicted HicB family RNase H-like nuclease